MRKQSQTDPHLRSMLVAATLLLVVAASAFILITETAAPIGARPPLPALVLAAAAAAWPFRVGAGTWERASRTAALLASSLLLTLHVLGRVPLLGREGDYSGVFLAWLLAAALAFLALACAQGSSPPAGTRPPIPRAAAWALGIAVAGAALLRLWHLGSVPYVFSADEASFALWAGGLSFWPMSNPFTAGWTSQPTLGMLYEQVSLKLFGASPTSARLPWALLSIPAIPAAFLLSARLRGTAVGLATAALLAAYHLHIHYARVALNIIADPLFMALALFWLVSAIERKRLFQWGLAGGTCGLALYFYPGARLTPLVALAVAVCAWFRLDREGRRGFPVGLAAAAGAFAVVAAPMLQFAFRYPADFNARVNIVGILQSGWLADEMAATGQPAFAILGRQLIRALGAFNLYPDESPFYYLPTPLLDPLFGLLFLAGLLWATGKASVSRRDWPLLAMVIWWWGGIVAGGALTLSPPTSHHFVTLTVPVCFFIALALQGLALALQRAFGVPPVLPLTLGTLLFAAVSLKTYFLDYTPQRRFGSESDALMTELLPAVRALGPKGSVVLAGAPFVYWDFPTYAFLEPQARGRDAPDHISAPLPADAVPKGETVLFVFVPERSGELAFVRKTFPDGLASTLNSPVDGRVMAVLYQAAR